MSQTISTGSRPKIINDVVWRRDGEDDQIIILSRENLPLPVILNPTAARIFSLCDREHSVQDIARSLAEEFLDADLDEVLRDVQQQLEYFLEKGIIEV
jgi:hypothetical protein